VIPRQADGRHKPHGWAADPCPRPNALCHRDRPLRCASAVPNRDGARQSRQDGRARGLFRELKNPTKTGMRIGNPCLLVPEPLYGRLFLRSRCRPFCRKSAGELAEKKDSRLERSKSRYLGARPDFMTRNPAGKVPVLTARRHHHVRKALRSVNTSKKPAAERRLMPSDPISG